jgi:hypothetical protein
MNPTEKKPETLEDYETAETLNIKYSLYVCTKDKENKDVIQSKIDIMRDKIKLFMCNTFGGCYEHPKGRGIWFNEDNQQIIEEGTYIISSYCSMSDSLKYENELIQLQKENCIYLNQHSATIERNKRMYFITAPPEFAQNEKEIVYGNEYKDDFKTLNDLKDYVSKHIIYSSLPLYDWKKIQDVEGREIKEGDLIYVYPKYYSKYSYDNFKRVVRCTTNYIFYAPVFAQGKLAYNCVQDFGQSKQLYYYEYNFYNDNNLRRIKNNKLISRLPEEYKNGFLHLTYFRH